MNRTLRACLLALLVVGGAILPTSCALLQGRGQTAPLPTTPSHIPPTATPSATPTAAPSATPVVTATATSTTAHNIPPTATSRIPTSPPDLSTSEPVPVYTYRIVNTYPHDPAAFTEGLVIQDGVLYEGTGLRGRSALRRVALDTGTVLQSRALAVQFFGEGVTLYGDRIYQLTWQSHIGFVYDKNTFDLLQDFDYATEGWGLTQDGEHLIMSDGTATLHFLDPVTLRETSQVQVEDRGRPVNELNELEYVLGEVYANVWRTDTIVRIDPLTGQVLGWIDLSGLLTPADMAQPVDVLNGIAYDAETDRLFVTGKLWPKLFEIELIPKVTG